MVAGVGYAAGRHGANRRAAEEAQNEQIAQLQAQQAQAAPPPAAAGESTDDMVEQLTKLKGLVDSGVLTQQEFDAQKAKILNG